MTLVFSFKVLSGQLKSRVKKKSFEGFLKNAVWSYLPYIAESDLKAKLLKRASFKAIVKIPLTCDSPYRI